MKVLLVINLLVIFCSPLSQSAIIGTNSEISKQLFIYNKGLTSLYKLLADECPEALKSEREVQDKMAATDLEVKKLIYQGLLKQLIQCREEKSKSKALVSTTNINGAATNPKSSSITKLSTTPTTMILSSTIQTTTIPTTTTIPDSCQSATNLTGSWRLNHNGTNLKPGGPHSKSGYACDFHKDLQWFRFTGSAGKICQARH